MLQFFVGMGFELFGDAHELRAFQDLRIHYVTDNCLIFARKVFV